jgi:YidC/Oxa1 family membrane protein insertase
VLQAIGAYGVAIIVLTIIIRLLLAPLAQFQLVTQRRTMAEQRKLAPQLAELRKKYKKDSARLNAETMKLYQEHGVNPLGGFVGCLPVVVQLPILTALYYVFRGFAPKAAHFLFVPNLNDNPTHHVLNIGGLPIPVISYLIFPLLAAATTLVQTKMLQTPPPLSAAQMDPQTQQTQQMQRTMVWLSPLMIGWFSLNVPAGLGLYWFVGNCVSIIQQSFVVGWGNLLPARFKQTPPSDPGPGFAAKRAPVGPPKPGPKNGPQTGPTNRPKDGPANRPKNGGPQNGSRQRKPKR